MTVVQVSEVVDFASLGERWREFEARADCSFFQSWTWVGCLASERYSDPVLVEASEAGRVVALGLFNRVGRTLYLHESGNPALDCPYIEQNGILTESFRTQELTAACLQAVTSRYRVVLSGVGAATMAGTRAAAALTWTRRVMDAPYIDLASVRAAGGDYLAGRSANTRQQIRRSDRVYERAGPIVVTRAESLARALSMLDAMAALHQAAWTARGKPGSFAAPFFRRFHRSLIERGWPKGEIDFQRMSSGETTIGFLYNFSFCNRYLAYQSGFDYAVPDRQAKPGLTCHHAAIRLALADNHGIYDFLAGEDRYKRSLGDSAQQQWWLEAGPFWSLNLLAHIARSKLESGLNLAGKCRDFLQARRTS